MYPNEIKTDVNILNLRFLLVDPSKGAGVHISFPAEVLYDLSIPQSLRCSLVLIYQKFEKFNYLSTQILFRPPPFRMLCCAQLLQMIHLGDLLDDSLRQRDCALVEALQFYITLIQQIFVPEPGWDDFTSCALSARLDFRVS